MAASYPSSLPIKDAAGAKLSTNPHSTLHDGMYDEIVAIATELGTVPKGTAASVKARLDALPVGVVGYAQITANQTSITTIVDVTSLTVTWTATASRRYRTSVYVSGSGTTTGEFHLTDGSNVQKQYCPVSGTSGQIPPSTFSVVETGLSGSTTRKVRALANAGTLTVQAGATYPAYILVEDIGPA